MTGTEIIQAIAQRGGLLRREGEQLRVRIAKGRLTEELRAALLERRDEVLALVTTYPCITCHQFHFREPETVCFWCRRRSPEQLS